jgi:hypothetical protein
VYVTDSIVQVRNDKEELGSGLKSCDY